MEDALAVFDTLVSRFGECKTPALQDAVAKALFNKGVALSALDRPEEALAAFEEVLRRFGGNEAPRQVFRPALPDWRREAHGLRKLLAG